jgi:hypothetical protein
MRRPSPAITAPPRTVSVFGAALHFFAASATNSSRACAAAFTIAVPLSFIELLPAV